MIINDQQQCLYENTLIFCNLDFSCELFRTKSSSFRALFRSCCHFERLFPQKEDIAIADIISRTSQPSKSFCTSILVIFASIPLSTQT